MYSICMCVCTCVFVCVRVHECMCVFSPLAPVARALISDYGCKLAEWQSLIITNKTVKGRGPSICTLQPDEGRRGQRGRVE
jgi:hypothetical protein